MPKERNIRTRVYQSKRFGGRLFRRNSQTLPWFLSGEGYTPSKGRQKTVSEGHHWPPPKGTLGDVGGEFYTSKSYVEGKPQNVSLHVRNVGTVEWKFNGSLYPAGVPVASGEVMFPDPSPSSDSTLDELGTTAIARCEPTNSVADASLFLGELLKDGLPSLIGVQSWKTRANAAVKAGGEFLNVVFGWRPLVSEVEAFAKAAAHAETVLAQYQRDAGRLVRRTYDFPTIKDTSEEIVDLFGRPVIPGAGLIFTGSSSSFGPVIRTIETVRHRRFAGGFTYAMELGEKSSKAMAANAQLADKLLGTSLTPELLWELAPWSWAVDWFSNAGDVVHNLSAYQEHGLVMRYGYMMEHTIVRHIYTPTPPYIFGSSLSGSKMLRGERTNVAPLTLVTETKVRRQANPFGFGLSWDGLSPLQSSILVALGISRRG